MKLFIGLIIAATIIGGFVGAEITDDDFSITGAVIGGVGVYSFLLGLGAFFDSQERKHRAREVSPEMRGVFDRMFGVDTQRSGKTFSEAMREKSPPPQILLADDEITESERDFLRNITAIMEILVSTSLLTRDVVVEKLLKNERALGYLYGFHFRSLERMGLANIERAKRNVGIIGKSYLSVFGEVQGFALMTKSAPLMINSKSDFHKGVVVAVRDFDDYVDRNIPPLAFSRILVLGLKE